MTYSEKLRDPRWQKKRLQILKRDKFKCTYCGDDKSELQIHHLKYSGEPWEVKNEFLITLCKDCHSIIEEIKIPYVLKVVKLQYVLESGEPCKCIIIKHSVNDRVVLKAFTSINGNKLKYLFTLDCKGELLNALKKLSK